MFHNLTYIFILLYNVETTHGFKNNLKKGQKNSQGTLSRETRNFLFPLIICSGYVVTAYSVPKCSVSKSIIYCIFICIFTLCVRHCRHGIIIYQQQSWTFGASYRCFPWTSFIGYDFSFVTDWTPNCALYFFRYYCHCDPPPSWTVIHHPCRHSCKRRLCSSAHCWDLHLLHAFLYS